MNQSKVTAPDSKLKSIARSVLTTLDFHCFATSLCLDSIKIES